MLVAETDHIEVHYRAGSSDYLWVPFAPMGYYADGTKPFWGERVSVMADISTLAFMAKAPNWYPLRDMEKALAAIRPLGINNRRIVTYGSSMGGYAALKYSKLVGATHAISFGPQVTIHPDHINPDFNPHRVYYNPEIHHDVTINKDDLCENAVVLYDPFDEIDAGCIAMLREISPSIGFVRVPLVGHEVIRVFAGTATTQSVIEHTFAGDMKALTRMGATRRTLPHRARVLLQFYCERNPHRAIALFKPFEDKIPARETIAFYFAAQRELRKRGDNSIESFVESRIHDLKKAITGA